MKHVIWVCWRNNRALLRRQYASLTPGVGVAPHKILHCCAIAGLLLFPPALLAEVLVVTGARSPPITLSKNQVRNIFLGRVTSLPNGSNVTLVDQPEFSPLREEFYLAVTNQSVDQAKQRWAILHFTGGGVPPREGSGSENIKSILRSTPGAISYIERPALDDSVKVIFIVP